ncbi:hypothetical protein FB451DRAFT_1561602, partial [Mycena latifolia]
MALVPFSVSRAVSKCISSPGYHPAPLLHILEGDWTIILSDSPDPASPVPAVAALPRDTLSAKGKEVLDWVLFLLIANDMDGKPDGFLATIKQAVASEDVLEKVMRKIDFRLLEYKAKRVDIGFRAVVGHAWVKMGRDMAWIVNWLELILGPLIHVAKIAYVEDLQTELPRSVRPGTRTRRSQREASDLVFLKNLRRVQRLELVSDVSETSDSGFPIKISSPQRIPAFEPWTRDLSPMNPGILGHSAPTIFSSHSDPEVPVHDSLSEFLVWDETVPIEGLTLLYEQPLNGIATPGALEPRILSELSVDEPDPRGIGLLAAFELKATMYLRTRREHHRQHA